MLTKDQEEKLRYFLESVNQISHPIAPDVRKNVFDIGLVIIEKNSRVKVEDIKKVFPKDKLGVLEYNNNRSERSFIEKMAELIEAKKWVLINLKADAGHNLINQLKNLSNDNIMQILDFKGREIYNLELPFESRVIVICQRDFLEKKISYPRFLNIFGPVISL